MTDWAYERVAFSIMTSGLPVGLPKAASELVSDFLSLPVGQDAENDADGDGLCGGMTFGDGGGCTDIGADGIIMVEDLNACLEDLSAVFFEVEYIEVAYGNTDSFARQWPFY